MADPKTGVEEIPFDVAEWGYRVVQDLYESDEERQAFLRAPDDPAYAALRKRAQELQKIRLG